MMDRKRKITNIPGIDTILLSNIDDCSNRSDKIGEIIDTSSESYDTLRKASDVSNNFSYGNAIVFLS